MATLDDILDKLNELEQRISDLENRPTTPEAIVVKEGLSDISEMLGLIKAGEFRSGSGEPGRGFSGVRMGYPGFSYDGAVYNIVGVDADTIQFGLRSCDGYGVTAEGKVTMSKDGVRVKSDGIENYHRRPLAIYNTTWNGDTVFGEVEYALRLADKPAPESTNRKIFSNLILRKPTTDGSTQGQYPFWDIEFVAYTQTSTETASTDNLKYGIALVVSPEPDVTPYCYLPLLYHGAGGAYVTRWEFVAADTDHPGELYVDFKKTSFMNIRDAGTDAATEHGWIEVQVGNNVGYIRVYGTK